MRYVVYGFAEAPKNTNFKFRVWAKIGNTAITTKILVFTNDEDDGPGDIKMGDLFEYSVTLGPATTPVEGIWVPGYPGKKRYFLWDSSLDLKIER